MSTLYKLCVDDNDELKQPVAKFFDL